MANHDICIAEINVKTGSEIHSYFVSVEFYGILLQYLADEYELLQQNQTVYLDNTNASLLLKKLELPRTCDKNAACLFKASKHHYLTYQIHTNRELDLMIAKSKPMAVFYKNTKEDFDIYGGQKFEELYKKHSFKKRVLRHNNVEYTFFTLPREQWRVEAYMLMLELRDSQGNNRHTEWLEGQLLGYTEEQNKEFLEKFYA